MSDRKTPRERRNANLTWSSIHSVAENLPVASREIWSGFDEIVCINLHERPDRYEKVKALFDSLQMPVRFHQVDRHPNGGVEGCYTSHIQVITSAHERGLNNILIFEDDVVAGKGLTARKILESANLARVPGVQIVYLGWHPQVLTSRTQHLFGSMHHVKAMGCHAYVLTKEMLATLANRPYDGTPIDVVLAQYPKAFGVYPTAFVQGMGDSNITNNFSNSKAMRPIRAFAEAYAVNVNIPPQWLLWSVIAGIVGVVLYHLLMKRQGTKMHLLGYIMIFLACFMLAIFAISRSNTSRK